MKIPRYGTRIRKLAKAADDKKKAAYVCPKCGRVAVVREGFSLWKCTKCGATFAGGAYTFQTDAGSIAKRLAKEKR